MSGGEMQNETVCPLVSVVTVVLNRAVPLATTIESVIAQTYPNIEHIIIDGGSDDDTIDIIRRYNAHLKFWSSEPDQGIYDAINKGIRRSSGKYILILHAGDSYDPNYITTLTAAARGLKRTIIYSNYCHEGKMVEAKTVSEAIFFHHLGVNHSTFLVPKEIYDELGGYDPVNRVVSDAVWIRTAFGSDIQFVHVDSFGLFFAEGGLSTAQSANHRELIISEWVGSYRKFFPFLPESIARNIYLYRFDEAMAESIVLYLDRVRSLEHFRDRYDLFQRGLAKAVEHMWSLRRLDASREKEFETRLQLAEILGISIRALNIRHKDEDLSAWIDRIDDLKRRVGDRSITLHYLEFFSRRTETFIPDLIARIAAHDGAAHVILCDKRVLASERPYDLIFAFDYSNYPTSFARCILETALDTLSPNGFVFHFIVNGWRLLSRVSARFQQIPAVYMAHGIDAFDLYRPSAYSLFVLNVVAKSPNARFTAVSNYLRSALVDVGIPFSRISLVHNVAHPRFHAGRNPAHAKAAARRASGFSARAVVIGRLVRWKGQADIVRAIAVLRTRSIEVHVTFVYGGEATDLEYLRDEVSKEGVGELVTFREAVDFGEEPTFLDDYDLLISASKYTNGVGARSETFGMSILEGIAAGLPVVVTDAGGQPEVAGPPNEHVRIAHHNDPESLAEEITALIKNGALDGDNVKVAAERVAHFSAERQMDLMMSIEQETRRTRLKPLLLSTAIDKGAGGAARGVHLALLSAGYASRLIFRNLIPDWQLIPAVEPIKGVPRVMGDHIHPAGKFLHQGNTIFSVDTDGIGRETLEELVNDADVINLHWYARFVSNADIAWLTHCGKPVVFTIRDMHPLTGGCHFFHGCNNWKIDCMPCPQLRPDGFDLAHQTNGMKRRNWNFENVTVVTLSDHTRRIVEQSSLFKSCRIETIPNPVDLTTFRVVEQAEARARLDLPRDKTIIAYMPSFNSTVKGAAEFQSTLRTLARSIAPEKLIIICAGRREVQIDCPFEIRQLGYLGDKKSIADFYAAADVTVVPSLEETFSNTAAESIACGTPVVGFATGAIPELAQGTRGRAVPTGDTFELANAVIEVLSHEKVDRNANHAYMREFHAPERIGRLYGELFVDLAARSRPVTPLRVKRETNSLALYLAARLTEAESRAKHAATGLAQKQILEVTASTAESRPNLPVTKGLARFAENATINLNLLRNLKHGPMVTMVNDKLILAAKQKPSHAVYGPYLRLDAGDYEIDIDVCSPMRDRFINPLVASSLTFEVAWNVDTILLSERIHAGRVRGVRYHWRKVFKISDEHANKAGPGFEVRIWTDGKVSWRVDKVALSQVHMSP